jgi:Xaa-Pro aminopeptidase
VRLWRFVGLGDLVMSRTHGGISGQYLDGTTDVTRTLHFGTPTDGQRRAFTRVLQGHIAIDTAIFPNGTSGL